MVGLGIYGKANGNLFQEDLCQHATLPRTASTPDPTAGHCWPMSLLETPKHSQKKINICPSTPPSGWPELRKLHPPLSTRKGTGSWITTCVTQ